MIFGRMLRQTAIAAGVVLAFAGLEAAPASAQLFWDWGGGDTVNGSGREVVRFSPQYTKGQVIVSFGDRRLYYITKPGEAISYPIAIPREQSRWAGVTSVTEKKVNPSWTPTPTMMAENPRLPRWVPGGHPMNPLGVRALYLGSSTYRIHGTDAPWTIGSAVSKGCIRMYNAGRARPLSARGRRGQGDGHLVALPGGRQQRQLVRLLRRAAEPVPADGPPAQAAARR